MNESNDCVTSSLTTDREMGMPKLRHIGSSNQADIETWWNMLSPPFLSMQSARYSDIEESRFAKFIHDEIVPSLGPTPGAGGLPHFDSFCNNDFSPVELSLNICSGKSTVRFGFEPIGHLAGTSQDPFNTLESIRVMSRLLAMKAYSDDAL